MAEQMQYMAKLGIDDSSLLSGLTNITQAFNTSMIGMAASVGLVTAALKLELDTLIDIGRMSGKMDDLSVATGISMEELEKFHYAARLGGLEVTAYDSLLAKLTLSMGKAGDAASEHAAAFQRIGVDPTGKSTTQVMLEVVDGLEGLETGAERAEIAMKLLGRSWVESYPIMRDYREWQDQINNHTALTTKELRELDAEWDEWNKFLADGTSLAEKYAVQIGLLSDKVNILKNFWDGLNGTAKASNEIATGGSQAAYSREAEKLVGQMSAAEKAGKAEQLKYLNEEYNAGNLTAEQYNAKRLALTGVADANISDAVVAALSEYTGGGWDQGTGSTGYWASGVQPYMGVMSSPTQANAYQLTVAQGLYQKYYDQLTGDKWGQQKYREEIARQMAYNEAAAGYKSEAERNAAVGYNPTGNITIINYNSLTNDETLQALAEEISRQQAMKL